MRRIILAATAVAVTLAVAPVGFAQARAGQSCAPDQRGCVLQDGRQRQSARAQPGKSAQAQKQAPRAGDNGRGGQQFKRAQNSRFKAPPRGQDYRVVNDHLVLVDSNTLKVVTVLGLLSTLLN